MGLDVLRALAVVAGALALSACSSTAFYGSAAAREGYEYVVGMKNNRAQIWLCPTHKPGDCQEVAVEGAD